MPSFSYNCEVNTETEELCISWLKPEGGYRIDNYIVEWVAEDNFKHFHAIPFNLTESNNYTVKNLQPAQAVNVSIRANNSAGESEASWKTYVTGTTLITIMYSIYQLLYFVLLGAATIKTTHVLDYDSCHLSMHGRILPLTWRNE